MIWSNGADQPRALPHYAQELRRMARARIAPELRGILDPSDLVQQTLLIACAKVDQFRGTTNAEFRAWLRTILRRALGRALRRSMDRRRDRIAPEEMRSGCSIADPWMAMVAEDTSPSESAGRAEELLRLAAAMELLPRDQRTAIELHHFQSLSLTEVSARMGRTPSSVAGLIFRGGRSLRRALQ